MGEPSTAVPSAIAGLGTQFIDEGADLELAASGFGGGALRVADAFGLLGACDGALEKYLSMAHSTVQGLEELARLWEQSGRLLIAQAEVHETGGTHQRTSTPGAGGGR